ncbi:methyltransferase domain-containing protein [Streptomyces sp. H34-S4]|uniref:methyltransferase domain-containing protein n=1 Tax=Streptomyces sp. H34-S4 TaxID=2996463 RepID=UPI00226E32AA|nr:methyltransferase domain-containing protein [Streptomyces sp. H34-S4]MCY0933596.1 methyltransferase domain-containing protein [Streptomyces sp. H34-S4]
MIDRATTEASLDGLASRLMETGALTSDWLPAYQTVPREQFVPDVMWPGEAVGTGQRDALDRNEDPVAWQEAVYSDVSLTTQWDDGRHSGKGKGKIPTCSNSQPQMVFSMLAALDVHEGCRVLEVGTGTGWNAALLSERLGSDSVTTIELDSENAMDARRRIEAAGYSPHMLVGDGGDGHPDGAPYDRILVTASVNRIPPKLIRQLQPGGVLVAPYTTTYGGGAVLRLTRQGNGTAHGPFVGSAAFMKLRQHRVTRQHVREYLGGVPWPADGVKSMTRLSPEAVGDWLPMFVIGLQTIGMFPWMENYKDGSYTLWLRDEAVTSWATVDYIPGSETFEVYQAGRRDLWTEVEAAHAWWANSGRPDFPRLGLTVDPTSDLHVAWLNSPDCPLPTVV